MAHKITLIPGDGIGSEITGAVVRIIESSGSNRVGELHAEAEALSRYGDPLLEPVLESIKRNRVALKGPLTTPVGAGFTSVNVRLRKTLDLYANLRPVEKPARIGHALRRPGPGRRAGWKTSIRGSNTWSCPAWSKA